MRFDELVDSRLMNWARWRIRREHGGAVPTASMEARVDGDGWDAETVITVWDADAEEIQAMVQRLDGIHRYAVEVWYLHPGSVATRCKKVQASETVVRTRVALAQRQIGQWLRDRRDAADRERERVEQMQRFSAANI